MLWCPDWPVLAAALVDGVDAHRPVAVLHANRVVVCSPAARAEGVRRGLRKREAQARCPHLVVVEHDPGRDARAFEPVVAAVEARVPAPSGTATPLSAPSKAPSERSWARACVISMELTPRPSAISEIPARMSP